MAFSLTTPQMRNKTKTVTRRIGSADWKPGERRVAIVKGQGLKKGEKVDRIGVIECVSNRPEPLWRLLRDPDYGKAEARREGFPEMDGLEFVEFFCAKNKCQRSLVVNRIEFKHIP